MTKAYLDILADQLCRLETEEIAQVLTKAKALAEERDGWEGAFAFRRGVEGADTEMGT